MRQADERAAHCMWVYNTKTTQRRKYLFGEGVASPFFAPRLRDDNDGLGPAARCYHHVKDTLCNPLSNDGLGGRPEHRL